MNTLDGDIRTTEMNTSTAMHGTSRRSKDKYQRQHRFQTLKYAQWSEPQCGGVIEIGHFDDITLYGK